MKMSEEVVTEDLEEKTEEKAMEPVRAVAMPAKKARGRRKKSEEKTEEKAMEPVRAVVVPAEKVPVVESVRRAAMPAKGVAKKVSSRTVKGKIALYQRTAAQFRSAASEMSRSGARDMQAGIRAIQSGIKEQTRKYKEGAADVQAGVAAILSGITDMQSSIVEQMKENQEYVKKFYG
jgi:hypothetical protein